MTTLYTRGLLLRRPWRQRPSKMALLSLQLSSLFFLLWAVVVCSSPDRLWRIDFDRVNTQPSGEKKVELVNLNLLLIVCLFFFAWFPLIASASLTHCGNWSDHLLFWSRALVSFFVCVPSVATSLNYFPFVDVDRSDYNKYPSQLHCHCGWMREGVVCSLVVPSPIK